MKVKTVKEIIFSGLNTIAHDSGSILEFPPIPIGTILEVNETTFTPQGITGLPIKGYQYSPRANVVFFIDKNQVTALTQEEKLKVIAKSFIPDIHNKKTFLNLGTILIGVFVIYKLIK